MYNGHLICAKFGPASMQLVWPLKKEIAIGTEIVGQKQNSKLSFYQIMHVYNDLSLII